MIHFAFQKMTLSEAIILKKNDFLFPTQNVFRVLKMNVCAYAYFLYLWWGAYLQIKQNYN